MKEKYKLLLKIKSLEFEIKELLYSCNEYLECFELLKEKLNQLCEFITDKSIEEQWDIWGEDYEIIHNVKNLRYMSCKALCNLEKYQAKNIKKEIKCEFCYTDDLKESVIEESQKLKITRTSKILFVGSGAMPTSAFTIAKNIGAEIMCIDIDQEALLLSEQVAKLMGLDKIIKFSNTKVNEVEFLKEATHVIIASLVEDKLELLNELSKLVKKDTKIIIRYGNGIKSVFNYPLDTCNIKDWKKTNIDYNKNIYETLVLER